MTTKLGPIHWRKDGYGTQALEFVSVSTDQLNCHTGDITTPYLRPGMYNMQRGYVKIWHNPKEPRVIDRALTVTAARKRIAQRKKKWNSP